MRKLDSNVRNNLTNILIEVLGSSSQTKSGLLFTQHFLSNSELSMLAKRVGVAILLKRGYTYSSIMNYLKVSKGTVAKISDILNNSDHESQLILDRIITTKKVSQAISELDYYLSRFLPPKGGNWSSWRAKLEQDHSQNSKPI